VQNSLLAILSIPPRSEPHVPQSASADWRPRPRPQSRRFWWPAAWQKLRVDLNITKHVAGEVQEKQYVGYDFSENRNTQLAFIAIHDFSEACPPPHISGPYGPVASAKVNISVYRHLLHVCWKIIHQDQDQDQDRVKWVSALEIETRVFKPPSHAYRTIITLPWASCQPACSGQHSLLSSAGGEMSNSLSCVGYLARRWVALERRSAWLVVNTQVKACSGETHSPSRASKTYGHNAFQIIHNYTYKPLLSTVAAHAHTVGSDRGYNSGWCRSHPTINEMT